MGGSLTSMGTAIISKMRTRSRVPTNDRSLVRAKSILPDYKVSITETMGKKLYVAYGLFFTFTFIYSFLVLLLPTAVLIPFLLPVALLFALVIWALPVSERQSSKAVRWLFWPYLISLLLWPAYFALYIPGLPWLTMPRLFGGPLILLICIDASTSQPFRAKMLEIIRSAPLITHLIVAFALIQVVSIGFSEYKFVTINRVINNQLSWTVIFFVGLWMSRDIKTIERLFGIYVICVFLMLILAVIESQIGHVIWRDSMPAFLKPPDPLIDHILQGQFRLTGQYRVQATKNTPLSFAEAVSLAVPFLAYFAIRYPRPLVLLCMILVDGLIFYCLVQADARLGFGTMLIGHLLLLGFFGLKLWQEKPSNLIGPAISLSFPAMGLLAASSVLFVAKVREKVLGGSQHKGSNDDRIEQWQIGLSKIWNSPLFGFGADRGGDVIGFRSPEGQLTIDSYYLSILMDYGFVGIFVFYGLFVYSIYVTIKNAIIQRGQLALMNMTVATFLFCFLIIKSVLSQAENHSWLFVGFAMALALSYHSSDRSRSAV